MKSLWRSTILFLIMFALIPGLIAMLLIIPGTQKDAFAKSGPLDDVTTGTLRTVSASGEVLEFPLKHTSVRAEVSAFLARVDVKQTFGNPSKNPIEAVYVFPLPENAAVDDMTMKIGDKVIKGVIKKREEARKIYEAAKNAGKTASLLEQERPNIFTQSVANIMPGDNIEISISYVADLKYEDGVYEFLFPTVVGPRYIPGNTVIGKQGGGWAPDTDIVPDASRITPPVLPPGTRSGHDIDIEVKIHQPTKFKDLHSVSHRIETSANEGFDTDIKLASDDKIPNKDFILRWTVAGEKPEAGVLTTGKSGEGFFLVQIVPKKAPKSSEITPKEMYFVVDTSGSMTGAPLAKAKEAMKRAISGMNPKDTFTILNFSMSVSTFSSTPLPNTPENVQKGLAYLDALQAGGGTEMLSGIRAALSGQNDKSDRIRIVLFMTDGYIGNENEILAEIQKSLGQARLFSFGVGSSVNHFLLDQMAEVGRGSVAYVRPDESTKHAIDRFYEMISSPYLTDVKLEYQGLEPLDVYPKKIPDLFQGKPLTIFGRFGKPGSGAVVVKGNIAGKPVSFNVPVEFPKNQEANSSLASLWARTKIKDLDTQMYRGEKPEIVNQITELALKYRLMSKYTSFVAVEEKVRNVDGKLTTVQVPVEMPEGVSYEGVFGADMKLAEKVKSSGGMGYGYAAMAPKGAPTLARSQNVVAKDEADKMNYQKKIDTFIQSIDVKGALDKEETEAALKTKDPEIKALVETLSKKGVNVSGSAEFKIKVKQDGSVESAELVTDTVSNVDLTDGLANILKKMRFPRTSGPSEIKVVYIF